MKPDRRDFIKTSGMFAVGSMVLPTFMQSCQNVQISANVKSYLDHFEVSTEMLQKVIAAAMSKGGNYADLFFEHKITNSLSLEDGQVNRAFSNVDFGVGIRVLKGDQTGFAYSENLGMDEMLNAAKMAANIADQPKEFAPVGISEKLPADFYPIAQNWTDVTIKDKVPFVQQLNDKVFSLDDKVNKVNVFLGDETSYVLFYNSEGRLTYDYRPMMRIGAVCVMEKDGQIENAYSARSFR